MQMTMRENLQHRAADRRHGSRRAPDRAMRHCGMGGERPDFKMLWRAMGYLGRYRRIALFAYGSLIVATLAQLAVPQLMQNLLDAVMRGYIAAQILNLPANVQALAAQRLNTTLAQLQVDQAGAVSALLIAMGGIVGFAILRALFVQPVIQR